MLGGTTGNRTSRGHTLTRGVVKEVEEMLGGVGRSRGLKTSNLAIA